MAINGSNHGQERNRNRPDTEEESGGPELKTGTPSTGGIENNSGDAVRFWGKRSPRPLTPEDGRQIAENLTSFFGVLAEWEAVAQAGPPVNAMDEVTTAKGEESATGTSRKGCTMLDDDPSSGSGGLKQ